MCECVCEERGGKGAYLIDAEITTPERLAPRRDFYPLSGHLLPRLVLVPFLALFLPRDEGVDLGDGGVPVDAAHVDGALEEGVHVEFAALGAEAEELKDAFEPAHELLEEAVVMDVDFVHELVEVVLVALAEVDEGLHGLVRVGRDVLPLGFVDDGEHVVGEDGEVGDAVVDVGRFVDAHEGFVEDGEEVAE